MLVSTIIVPRLVKPAELEANAAASSARSSAISPASAVEGEVLLGMLEVAARFEMTSATFIRRGRREPLSCVGCLFSDSAAPSVSDVRQDSPHFALVVLLLG